MNAYDAPWLCPVGSWSMGATMDSAFRKPNQAVSAHATRAAGVSPELSQSPNFSRIGSQSVGVRDVIVFCELLELSSGQLALLG